MEVVDDGGAAEVEEVLALAVVASAGALPAAEVGEAVLDGDALAEPGPAGRAALPLAQLGPEPLVGVDGDGAAVGAGGAAGAEGADGAGRLGEAVAVRTGQALQKMVRSGGRSRTQPLLR